MSTHSTTNAAPGSPTSTKESVLHTGASLTQSFEPTQALCAHLNAFHVYASDTRRCVETNHYCAHVNEDVRQCILYDGDGPGARLIGVEYMIKPHLYEGLDAEERKLWHSHVFEVKSGMLIMPTPRGMPNAAWEVAETEEMKEVVHLYGKVFHLWQTDRGDKLPLGKPELMTSFTSADQFDFEAAVGDRDKRFGVDHKQKAEKRAGIEEPAIHPDADAAWKK